MLVLGIDTATSLGSVAVVDESGVRAERKTQIEGPHSSLLLPMIDLALRDVGASLSDLGGIAVSIGPGSFTGLRVGVSTAKALSYASEKPIVGISTLMALAFVGASFYPEISFVCPMLDARKGEVFAALFERRDRSLVRVGAEMVAEPGRYLDRIHQGGGLLFLGSGADLHFQEISHRFGNRAQRLDSGASTPSARGVALLGMRRLLLGEEDELSGLAPVYGRPSYAESDSLENGLPSGHD